MKIDDSGMPMMSVDEMTKIDMLIEEHKPSVCLEFGSGNSTIHFPNKHECIKQWVSIEHNGHYNKYLQDKVNTDKVVLMWEPEDQWYVDSVKHQINKYDLIFIDGKHREGCFNIAFDMVKKGGLILLHDAGRSHYREWFQKHDHVMLTEGEIPSKSGGFEHRGIALFRK